MAKQPSDIAPELPELQREDRERYPDPDSATRADERADGGETTEDDDELVDGNVSPDAAHAE